MEASPAGIDPETTFMAGTLNVGTSFMLNERLDFNDPDLKKVMAWIDVSANFTSVFRTTLSTFSTTS